MRTRLPALALATATVALAITGCSSEDGSPATPTARPTVTQEAVGGMLLDHGVTENTSWALAADHDDQGRLCMAFVLGPERAAMSRTCGLPDAAASGYRVAAVPGPGKSHFYYSSVPANADQVKLTFAGGHSTTVKTQPTPAQLGGETAKFFIAQAPDGVEGAATLTLLDADGAPLR